MEIIDNIEHRQIYIECDLVTGTTDSWIFTHKDRTQHLVPEFDFWIPILINRSYKNFEYVSVDIDESIDVIERQNVNPYFVEFSFFDSIQTHTPVKGSNLTASMVSYIKENKPELSGSTSQEVKEWYDITGFNSLPWEGVSGNKITSNDISTASTTSSQTVSKANYFNIDINR